MRCKGCNKNWAVLGFTACRPCRDRAARCRGPARRAISLEARIFGRCRVVGDCWEFEGTPKSLYAGSVMVDGERQPAYRWVLRLSCGECPAGHEADHSCHNPKCCNPAHLRWSTVADNRTRMVRHLTPDARRLAHNAYQREYQQWARIEGRAAGKIRLKNGAWVIPRPVNDLAAIVDAAMLKAGAPR